MRVAPDLELEQITPFYCS